LISCVFLIKTVAFASEKRDFDYGLDVNFDYLGALNSNDSDSATIGLTKFEIAMDWKLLQQTGLSFGLRPDALTHDDDQGQTSVAREFDSRSGDTYKKNANIYLLDTYEVSLIPSDQFKIALGVSKEMLRRRVAYRSILEFGLLAKMPEKFASINVDWNNYVGRSNTAQLEPSSGDSVKLWVFQGDRDRAETRKRSDKVFGEVVTAKDSHVGVACYYGKSISDINEFGVLFGMSDESATDLPKARQDFLQLVNVLSFSVLSHQAKVSADLRWSRESYAKSDTPEKNRTQYSASISSSYEFVVNQWALLGVHVGESDRAGGESFSGYQIDLGYNYSVAKDIDFLAMCSLESREKKLNDGSKVSGFVKKSGESSSKDLTRFAVGVNYKLQGNI
jgi:hypothetical protein